MSNWASKFKDKHELRREEYKREIADWERRIQKATKEILAGAPDRDHGGVRDLKDGLDLAYKEKAKMESTGK